MNDQEHMLARNRALELLNMIHNPTNQTKKSFQLPTLFSSHEMDFSQDNALIFGGRCVVSVNRVAPLKVSKRFLKPQMGSDGHFRPDTERILQRLFGVLDLRHLLLLITPTAQVRRQSDELVLHGFEVATQLHLGVTIITAEEREVLERQHNLDNYALICCSGYVDLEDLFMKTPIKDQIFDVLRHKPAKGVCVWNADSRIIVQYRLCDAEKVIIIGSRDKSNKFVAAKVTPKESMPDLPSQRESATMLRQLGGDEIVPQPVEDQKKRKALKKSPERQVAKMTMAGNLSFLDRSEFRQTEIGKKRKKRKKPKQKRTTSMARDADPVERQQLAQQLDKERLHLLERKWHGFGNANSQRRGVFNSKRE